MEPPIGYGLTRRSIFPQSRLGERRLSVIDYRGGPPVIRGRKWDQIRIALDDYPLAD